MDLLHLITSGVNDQWCLVTWSYFVINSIAAMFSLSIGSIGLCFLTQCILYSYSTAIYQSWVEEGSSTDPSNTIIRVSHKKCKNFCQKFKKKFVIDFQIFETIFFWQVRSAGRMGDKDGKITSRLSHLTGLVLDDYSSCQNGMETGSLWSIADGDKREVEWARRLLHRSADNSISSQHRHNY